MSRHEMYVTVTSGLRGYFAVLIENEMPVQSGIGSYPTAGEAEEEAVEWARAEGLSFRSNTKRRVP
jgi:hypothetical protein